MNVGFTYGLSTTSILKRSSIVVKRLREVDLRVIDLCASP